MSNFWKILVLRLLEIADSWHFFLLVLEFLNPIWSLSRNYRFINWYTQYILLDVKLLYFIQKLLLVHFHLIRLGLWYKIYGRDILLLLFVDVGKWISFMFLSHSLLHPQIVLELWMSLMICRICWYVIFDWWNML